MKIFKILGILLLVIVLVVGLLAGYIHWMPSPSFGKKNIDLKIETNSESINTGRKIVLNYCVSCHMSNHGTLSGRVLMDHPEWGVIYTGNLTKHPESNISAYSNEELYYFLRTGIKKNGQMALPMMPKLAKMSDKDLNSLIAFLRSDDELVEPTESNLKESRPSFFLKALMKFVIKPVLYEGETVIHPSKDDLLKYGEYLVNGRYSCFECHSRSNAKINHLNPTESEGYLGGGSKLLIYGNAVGIRTPNITPDKGSGIGNWSFEEFHKAIVEGKRPDDKVLRPPMNRLVLDSVEIMALWQYLRSVPPLSNNWEYESRIELSEVN